MNKPEFVQSVALKMKITQAEAARFVDAVFDPKDGLIVTEVATGGALKLAGFGVFSSRERAARKGHNPQTNTPLQIPAKVVPVFKFGKVFADKVAG